MKRSAWPAYVGNLLDDNARLLVDRAQRIAQPPELKHRRRWWYCVLVKGGGTVWVVRLRGNWRGPADLVDFERYVFRRGEPQDLLLTFDQAHGVLLWGRFLLRADRALRGVRT